MWSGQEVLEGRGEGVWSGQEVLEGRGEGVWSGQEVLEGRGRECGVGKRYLRVGEGVWSGQEVLEGRGRECGRIVKFIGQTGVCMWGWCVFMYIYVYMCGLVCVHVDLVYVCGV